MLFVPAVGLTSSVAWCYLVDRHFVRCFVFQEQGYLAAHSLEDSFANSRKAPSENVQAEQFGGGGGDDADADCLAE